MAFDKTKFLTRFVDEAREHCSVLNDGLLSLDQSLGDPEMVHMIFRAAHSIKGSARMMKLTAISEVAHHIEDALDAVKQQRLTFSAELFDLLFQGVDAILSLLERVAVGEEELPSQTEICERLDQAVQGNATASSVVTATESKPSSQKQPPDSVQNTSQKSSSGDEKEKGPVSSSPDPPKGDPVVKTAVLKSETVRVDADKLDRLIKLMGEIVSGQIRMRHHLDLLTSGEQLAREHVALVERTQVDAETDRSAKHLHKLLREALKTIKESNTMQELLADDLQDVSLQMRMVPLSVAFEPLKRVVRDIAREMSKTVDFRIEGGETQLDKKMVEKIGDPLMHMVRNAIDHGIEASDQRGDKPSTGRLTLSSSREGENVLIVLEDDGCGISLAKIREKALAKRLVDEATLATMTDDEITNLIFEPGFSTSEIITDISGRGVGMDVVKRNFVEELKGSILVRSREGEGTCFQVRLPQTLAIFSLLFFTVGHQTVAVPSDAIVEIVAVKPEEIIQVVNKRAVRLRNQIIPVEELGAMLGLDAPLKLNEGSYYLAISQAGKERFGLLFDEVISEQDMVVKPLPTQMKKSKLVTGVVIGGNNELINVLNMNGLYQAIKEYKTLNKGQASRQGDHAQTHILVADDSLNTREIEKSILEAYGYTVSLAEDGLDALEKTRECQFDLIVTDVEMPRMNGFTLTENLRGDPNYTSTPIIIVTSLEKESDKRRGIKAGANAYIVKGSFDQTNLLDTVKSLVG